MDYTAFESTDISYQDAYKESRARLALFMKGANKLFLGLIAISFFMLFTFLLIFNVGVFQENSGSLKLFALVLDATVIMLILYGISYFGKRAVTLRRFAESNGFTFKPQLVIPKDSGELFHYGYYQISRNGVQGIHDGKHFMLFDYRYAKGSARYPAPQIFTVLLLNAGVHVDHVILKNKNGHMKSLKFKRPVVTDEIPGVSDRYSIQASDRDVETIKKNILQSEFIPAVLKASPRADIELKVANLFIYMSRTLRSALSIKLLFLSIVNIRV